MFLLPVLRTVTSRSRFADRGNQNLRETLSITLIEIKHAEQRAAPPAWLIMSAQQEQNGDGDPVTLRSTWLMAQVQCAAAVWVCLSKNTFINVSMRRRAPIIPK